MFDKHASYTIVFEDDKAVFIMDVDAGGPSITNDAENVCRQLLTLRKMKRIIYRDTMGNWDELSHNGMVFSHYSHIEKNDPINEVLEEVRKRIF